MNDIEIRELKEQEWDSAMALVWKVFLRFEAGDYDEKGIKSFMDFISDERLKKMFLAGEYKVLVAATEETIRGVITLRNENHISLLFVDSDFHKQGIGRKLICAMADYVRSQGRKQEMTVNASPYGVGFYHKIGFTDTALRQMRDGIIYTPMRYSLT